MDVSGRQRLRRAAGRLFPGPIRHRLGRLADRLGHGVRVARAAAAARAASRRVRVPRQVVFVSDRPRSREAKLAYGLSQIGWEVVLLHRHPPEFDASGCFAAVGRYDSPQDAVLAASRHAPAVYHVFSCWDFSVAQAMIRHRPGNVVFDDYDVLTGMMEERFVEEHYPAALSSERYCLEHADGICCRSLETQFVRRRQHLHFGGPRVLVLDGCWSESRGRSAEAPARAGEIHVVYCGNTPILSEEGAAGPPRRLAERFAEQSAHLHIYPSPFRWDAVRNDRGWKSLLASWSCVHLHPPVPADRLAEELSVYDAGIFDVSLFVQAHTRSYSPWKYVYASSNKLFDYWDAGLPVLLSSTRFQHFLLRRFGGGVLLDAAATTSPAALPRLRDLPWETLRAGARRACRQYSVVGQAARLAAFYQALSGGAPPPGSPPAAKTRQGQPASEPV